MTRAWDKEKNLNSQRNRPFDLPVNIGRAFCPVSYENSWRARSFTDFICDTRSVYCQDRQCAPTQCSGGRGFDSSDFFLSPVIVSCWPFHLFHKMRSYASFLLKKNKAKAISTLFWFNIFLQNLLMLVFLTFPNVCPLMASTSFFLDIDYCGSETISKHHLCSWKSGRWILFALKLNI